jgi:hypothetical protein
MRLALRQDGSVKGDLILWHCVLIPIPFPVKRTIEPNPAAVN